MGVIQLGQHAWGAAVTRWGNLERIAIDSNGGLWLLDFFQHGPFGQKSREIVGAHIQGFVQHPQGSIEVAQQPQGHGPVQCAVVCPSITVCLIKQNKGLARIAAGQGLTRTDQQVFLWRWRGGHARLFLTIIMTAL